MVEITEDPDNFILTVTVPKEGIPDGVRRIEILAQGQAQLAGAHTRDQQRDPKTQKLLTAEEIDAKDDLSRKQKNQLHADEMDWSGIKSVIVKDEVVTPK